MNTFLIEVVNSKWGVVKLKAVKINSTWEFHYPSGEYMGSLDEEYGGGLGWPTEEINTFMRKYRVDSLEWDDTSYCQVEDELIRLINKHDPGFFTEDKVRPDFI